jgi:phosphoglycolate phosphatase-like HAD superfamily hydrolase
MALLLFDIDGTLIRPTGMGRRAFEKALRELYGGALPEHFPYDGMLDTQIAARTLSQMGLAPTPSAVDRLLDLYVEHLQGECPPDPAPHRCPGIPALLEQAPGRGHHLGLLTGNVRGGALAKLSFMGLAGYFQDGPEGGGLLGAFGGDGQQRWELVPVAMARCERAYGKQFNLRQTWLVGDSPKDVQAAHTAGVRCAAVGTGFTSLQTLANYSPDLLLQDLADPAALWAGVEDAT